MLLRLFAEPSSAFIGPTLNKLFGTLTDIEVFIIHSCHNLNDKSTSYRPVTIVVQRA